MDYELKPEVLKLRIACILIEDGKILLAKHRRDEREYWTLPGGGLQKGERITDCLRREIWEEGGLEIEIEDVLFVYDTIEPSRHIVTIVLRARKVGGELKPKNIPVEGRLVDMQFIPMEKLEEIVLLPPIAGEIKRAINSRGVPYLGDLWRR
ncbi:NUDIX hydrolase [bacterium]|nr:NUDIX hydrolase [bacterium]